MQLSLLGGEADWAAHRTSWQHRVCKAKYRYRFQQVQTRPALTGKATPGVPSRGLCLLRVATVLLSELLNR